MRLDNYLSESPLRNQLSYLLRTPRIILELSKDEYAVFVAIEYILSSSVSTLPVSLSPDFKLCLRVLTEVDLDSKEATYLFRYQFMSTISSETSLNEFTRCVIFLIDKAVTRQSSKVPSKFL